MSEEGSEDNPEGRRFVPLVSGLKYRRRVDPATSSKRNLYRIVRSTSFSIRGKRTHFKIMDGNTAIYSAKLKYRHQTEPIPICNGAEAHYSEKKHTAYLLTDESCLSFGLKAKNEFGSEIIAVQHIQNKEDKSIPKIIKMDLFLKDSLIPQKLISKMPIASDDGEWVLDFHSKNVLPSVKNVVLVDEKQTLEYLIVRKVDKDIVEAEAVPIMSPLAVFGFVLTMFIAPA